MAKYKSQEEAEAAGIHIRKVRSFILREGRLTKGQMAALDAHWSEMGLDFQSELFDIDTLFSNPAPLVLEIGFGMGKSLVDMASQAPNMNFIGIEVHTPGVGSCLTEAQAAGLTNLKVMGHDAVAVLNQCIPDASLHRLQLYFPDPWHKKRHRKRRIVQPEFAQLVRQKLNVGGVFHMATDWEDYARYMLKVMTPAEGFKNLSEDANYVPRPEYRPITKFEKRGERLGHGVWDLLFEKEH